jgi:hypothetical protein
MSVTKEPRPSSFRPNVTVVTAGAHIDSPSPAGGGAPSNTSVETIFSPGMTARQALRYAIARLAIDLVSGPAGLASALRTGLLDAPCNSRSVPLDIGC